MQSCLRFVLGVLALSLLVVPASAQSGCKGTALCIIDGDTFHFRGTRYRIANIDAPELHEAKCDAERRLAIVAKARLAALLVPGSFRIVPGDPVDGRLKDRYGRTLATVKVGGKDVGEILVSEQLARRWAGRRAGWCYRLRQPFEDPSTPL